MASALGLAVEHQPVAENGRADLPEWLKHLPCDHGRWSDLFDAGLLEIVRLSGHETRETERTVYELRIGGPSPRTLYACVVVRWWAGEDADVITEAAVRESEYDARTALDPVPYPVSLEVLRIAEMADPVHRVTALRDRGWLPADTDLERLANAWLDRVRAGWREHCEERGEPVTDVPDSFRSGWLSAQHTSPIVETRIARSLTGAAPEVLQVCEVREYRDDRRGYQERRQENRS